MSGNFAIKGGGVGRLMANAILNFHFDYLNPSLRVIWWFSDLAIDYSWEIEIMTLRVSDWQSKSHLDSILKRFKTHLPNRRRQQQILIDLVPSWKILYLWNKTFEIALDYLCSSWQKYVQRWH